MSYDALVLRTLLPLTLAATLVSACGGETEPAISSLASSPSFALVDVTVEAGLGDFKHQRGATGDLWFPEINGSGAAFIDYDSDGWQDLLIAGGGVWEGSGADPVPAVWLYRNERDGRFSLQNEAAGLSNVHAYAYGLAVADYDNDGDDDFYLTTTSSNFLFRNEAGRFVDVSAGSGTAGPPEWSNSAAFLDADRDGLLDLFVTNYVRWSPEEDIPCLFGAENRKDYCTPHAYEGLPPRFYRQNEDHTFTDRTADAGFLPSPGKSMGVAALDLNQDRAPDLAVSNDGEPDQLFLNEGDGHFVEVGLMRGMALNSRGQPQAGMGIDAGQVDETGHPAIVVGNFSNETISLFQYDGIGLFDELSRSAGIGSASLNSLTFAVLLFDVDLDGDLDLCAANGHISLFAEQDDDPDTFEQAPHLFLNDGSGQFVDVAPELPDLGEPLLGRGAAYADYDRDGDLDLILTENDGPVRLLRNDARTEKAGPAYLRIALEGTRSNRSAIGAELTLYENGRLQRRYVRSGSSYLSQSELPVTFGLASSAAADSLIINWPSGHSDAFYEIDANRSYSLVEGSGVLTTD